MKLKNGQNGHLQVLKKIGDGGFAAVYLARKICDEAKDVFREVAIKVGDKAALQREFDAHQLLGKQIHIVIPPTSHLEDAELPCLEYEYAQYRDLYKYLETFQGGVRQLTAMQATSIFLQVVTGVANAHGLKGDNSFIHRDLKPGNILVFEGKNGRPEFRVTDFGISHKTRKSPSVSSMTKKPFRGGTPDYWSPQQKAGILNPDINPDKQDDVYSLGKIWYQLLANKFEDIWSDLEGQLNKIRPELPKEIKELVMQCVDEDRTEDMPKDAVELKDRLVKLQIAMRPPRDNLLNDLWIQRKWQVPILEHIAKEENRSEYSPSWGYVLEKDLDESVVTNRFFRERIVATGLPWRVWDKGTKIEMLLIPSGRFMMGATPDDKNAVSNEKPLHQVLISKAFYLSRTPVTQAQWLAKMGSNPSGFIGTFGRPECPVEQVSWDMVQEFNTVTGFRLPTEAEWEYACRAGATTSRYGILDHIAWHGGNSSNTTHRVRQKLANPLGLYDMFGNVWEWCQDWCGDYCAIGVVNPTGPTTGTERSLRGGDWSSVHSEHYRASGRYSEDGNAKNYIGFRVARTP